MVNIASHMIGPLHGIPKPENDIKSHNEDEFCIGSVSPKIIVESVTMV